MHAQNIKKKLTSRNNVLKALAGSFWGIEKEVMLTTFKAISKPLINYWAPIWTLTLCDSQWQELQACQNSALRTALGFTKMTSAHHLHPESLVMPAKAHNKMLSKQFLLRTKLADHPNKQDADNIPPNFRLMKPTLLTKFEASIQHLAPDNPNETKYKARHQGHPWLLHDRSHPCPIQAIHALSNNRVLGARPPPQDQPK